MKQQQDRILVVEDNPDAGSMFTRIAKETGAVVDLVSSERQALAQVRNTTYDVALIDIMLADDTADRGGLHVIQFLKEAGSSTLVVVISATHDLQVPITAFGAGIVAYLNKHDIRSSSDVLTALRKALKAAHECRKRSAARTKPAQHSEGLGGGQASERDILTRFNDLVEEWEEQSAHVSSPVQMAMLPSYQQIIGLGPKALPLILERLSSQPDHWFWALRSITGTDPISPDDAGRMDKMREAWLRWGKENGIIR